MLIHEKSPKRKRHLWKTDEQAVESCDHPQAAEFGSYRAWTGFRSERNSPRLPGLSLVKRAILRAYRWRLLSLRSAQRLVDLSKCWEA